MGFVQLLFDFLLPAATEPAAPARRVRKSARGKGRGRSESTKAKRAPRQPRDPHDVPAASILLPTSPASARVMPKPPRGIDHARPVQRRYDAIVAEMVARYGLRVRRWRNSLSGLATLRIYRDGHEERWIESPYPTSPLRLAIFLHEVGHHAIGLGVHKPRCLEEYLAWRFAIDRMRELGLPVDGTVARRFDRSMRYAVSKSVRRGIRSLPPEVVAFAATEA
jgi:hypothetical protein